MRTIIAGGRDIIGEEADVSIELAVLHCGWQVTEVVSGMAEGIDLAGERWAKQYNIPIKQFPADWKKHGRSAGPRRNTEMAQYAEALIAVWDGQSRGTANMIEQARSHGLRVFVYRVI